MSYRDIPDHPVIAAMERTGHPDGREPDEPICLLCGGVCETIYRRKADGEILGCDLCIEDVEPWEVCG